MDRPPGGGRADLRCPAPRRNALLPGGKIAAKLTAVKRGGETGR